MSHAARGTVTDCRIGHARARVAHAGYRVSFLSANTAHLVRLFRRAAGGTGDLAGSTRRWAVRLGDALPGSTPVCLSGQDIGGC